MTNIILKLPAVLARTSLSRAALYVLVSEHKFPKQVRLNKRSCGWVESEVQEWIDQRIANRDNGVDVFEEVEA